ncbi:MAG: serine/threonine protein kinase [Kofleriaceae bacterium]|nr:serine/threonine protein kinase [Kofleriaceae bacterium]MBP9168277.1 serine/threonine protein kinase [Kofleriaceae bacterium]MBP9862719.1 serine/threonine protein kinase [Kofleriaceae bacterium]
MRARYTVLERLGGGGQAEVFRGVAETLQGFRKTVAIKRVLPTLSGNPRFVAMFLDEARLSLFLQHANVVQVFDITKAADDAYLLVMEFVDGCDLKAAIEREARGGRLIELRLVLHIIIESCKGLHYAHTLEHPETGQPLHIVHRDVSPPNIMLSKNGEVKIVDFGLAKANSQVEQTDQGVVKGKFSYLSPEAAWGLEIDARTDVFAIGILLWEMLTGRRLFYADTAYATVELVREARVPSVTALNPNVDAELDAIVRKALARDPVERYQTAADVGDALANYLFSHELKVTSRDVANLVRDGRAAERARGTRLSLVDAVVADQRAAMLAEVAAELAAAARPTGEAFALETTAVRDWVSELGLDLE